VKEDFKKISRVFYELFVGTVMPIVEMKNKENSIRTIRNSFYHDNYFFMSDLDDMNITYTEKLRVCPFLGPQWNIDRLKKYDYVTLDMYDQDGVKCITFCYIIKANICE